MKSFAKPTGEAGPEKRRIYLPAPRPHQLSFLLHPARYKVLRCGRRWGKGVLGLVAVIEGHGPHQARWKGALDGGNIWWVAPTTDVAAGMWRDLKHALKEVWIGKSEVSHRIVLPTGGSITIKSADNPDSLRGAGLDGVVIDEAAFCDPETWTLALRPALSDRKGWALFLSTPDDENWFKILCESAAADRTGQWVEFWRPSSDNLSPEEIAAAKLDLGTYAFRREYLAEFVVATAGSIFRREWFHVVSVRPHITRRVRSWDLAASVGENAKRTAGILLGAHAGGWIVEDMVLGKWTPGARDEVILQTARRDPIGTEILIEQEPGSGGLAQIDTLRRLLAGYHVTAIHPTGDKVVRANPVSGQAEAKKISLLAGSWNGSFLSELEEFPDGAYKDQVDALSMAFARLAGVLPGGPVKAPATTQGDTPESVWAGSMPLR